MSPDKPVQYSHAGSAVSFSADALLPCQGGRAPPGIWRAWCVPEGWSVCVAQVWPALAKGEENLK